METKVSFIKLGFAIGLLCPSATKKSIVNATKSECENYIQIAKRWESIEKNVKLTNSKKEKLIQKLIKRQDQSFKKICRLSSQCLFYDLKMGLTLLRYIIPLIMNNKLSFLIKL